MKEPIYSLTSIGSKDSRTQAEILIQKMEEIRLEVATARGKLLASRVDIILHQIASTTGVPMCEWDLDQWKVKCRILFGIVLEMMEEEDERRSEINRLLAEQSSQRAANRLRIRDRPDQVTKRAFQQAAMMNRDVYETKAEAIRDLRVKPQFADHPDSTLRRWLKDIWKTKPAKIGTPKKGKK